MQIPDVCDGGRFSALQNILEVDPADDSGLQSAEGEENGADATIRSRPAKEPKHNTSPSATLESSFEALNVKKFDLTFAMDPLFKRTSAQFDEGGAKGGSSQFNASKVHFLCAWAACSSISLASVLRTEGTRLEAFNEPVEQSGGREKKDECV